mmetsp:Transcript_88765/g.256000  ORF Transcript_88765/g.256000 Transcript_88765/m.256000 type:complete len:211 (+) Transcript_88765:117-749(+)
MEQQGGSAGVARMVESGIYETFRQHPDADLLTSLALLEVASNDVHRETLESAVDDPERFRQYAFSMVGAVIPDEDLDHSRCAEGGLAPISSAQRQRIRSSMSRRLDESLRLETGATGPEAASPLDDDALDALEHTVGSNFAEAFGIFDGGPAASVAPPAEGEGEVARAVPPKEVRKAYLDLARQYHPDKGGDNDMFLALQSAYELLRADA